ncbi:MAG: hypothetical protein ACRENK_02655, partial [Gemmatimonadaceae bacterium]
FAHDGANGRDDIRARSGERRIGSALMNPAREIATRNAGGSNRAADASTQIDAFLDKYTPEMASAARRARARMRKQIPGGVEFVYDNYNALVFGYGPSDRPSEAVVSLAIMPKWVTLCFLKGTKLADPKKLLKGSGSTVRNVRLIPPLTLDDAEVQRLIDAAIAAARPPFPVGKAAPSTIVKSISAKQRPRRPRTEIS